MDVFQEIFTGNHNQNQVIEYSDVLKAGDSGALITQNGKIVGQHSASIKNIASIKNAVGIGKRIGADLKDIATNYGEKFKLNRRNY